MLEDILRSISIAEKEAEDAVASATDSARNMVKSAMDKAEKDVEDAIYKAKEFAKNDKLKAIDSAEKEAQKRMDKGIAEAAALKKSKAQEIDKLADEIVEKVLRAYVND